MGLLFLEKKRNCKFCNKLAKSVHCCLKHIQRTSKNRKVVKYCPLGRTIDSTKDATIDELSTEYYNQIRRA